MLKRMFIKISSYNRDRFWRWLSEDRERFNTNTTRTVHVQFQKDFMHFVLLSFLKIPLTHDNHQSVNPCVVCHQEISKLNTHAQQHSVQVFHSSLFTNQMNTPGLGFFLDYLCLCSAPFQSLSRRRSSRGTHFLRWSSRSAAACWRARYFCTDRNLLVFSVEISWRVKHQTTRPVCLHNHKTICCANVEFSS